MAASAPSFPASVTDVLEPTWLTSVLSDVSPGERVTDVELVQSFQTIAEKARFRVTIEGHDGAFRHRSYFVKVQQGRRGSPAIGAREVRFYGDLAARLEVLAPNAYFAGTSDDGSTNVIIMDDVVASGGVPMSADRSFSVDEAERTVAELAALHASTWGLGEVGHLAWLAPTVVPALFESFSIELLQGLLNDGRVDGFPAELRDAEQLLDAVRHTVARPVTCVVHADTHSGNTYIDAGGRGGWLDWQLVQVGHWALDVSYHLGVVLDVDDRRAHEEHLLRHYLEQLGSHGAAAPEWETAWEHYTSAFAYGYYLWSITQVTAREVILVNAPRLASALVDHDTLSRLGRA